MRRVTALSFDPNGLVPVIVQDVATGEIRMFAFASREAVETTLATGRATFWSRSRGELWEKGRTSGNPIRVKRILVDCDNDCLIYTSEPEGPSCHTGAENCFFQILGPSLEIEQHSEVPQSVLPTLERVLEERKGSTAKASYTKSLYDGGARAIGAKVREEATELAAALDGSGDDRVVAEAADLLYHVLVALRSRNVSLRDVLRELASRMGTGGHEEKARRSF
jgi:phosphoribosyl-AMP cyclohydrolase / phosphoribosyl-ATP pyrophosphohydrolase